MSDFVSKHYLCRAILVCRLAIAWSFSDRSYFQSLHTFLCWSGTFGRIKGQYTLFPSLFHNCTGKHCTELSLHSLHLQGLVCLNNAHTFPYRSSTSWKTLLCPSSLLFLLDICSVLVSGLSTGSWRLPRQITSFYSSPSHNLFFIHLPTFQTRPVSEEFGDFGISFFTALSIYWHGDRGFSKLFSQVLAIYPLSISSSNFSNFSDPSSLDFTFIATVCVISPGLPYIIRVISGIKSSLFFKIFQ